MFEQLLTSGMKPVANLKFKWTPVKKWPWTIRDTAIASIGDKIYAFGGSRAQQPGEVYADYTYPKTFTIYDIKTDTYENLVGTPPGRTSSYATALGKKFYIAGGAYASGVTDFALWEYDVDAQTWTTRPSLPGALLPAGSFNITGMTNSNGYLFVTVYNNTAQVTELYRWNPTTPTAAWEKMRNMPTSQLNAGAIVGIPNFIYYFGGRISGTYTNVVYFYNVQTNVWQVLNPLPRTVNYVQAVNINNVPYVIFADHITPMEIYSFNGTSLEAKTQLPPPPLSVVAAGVVSNGNTIHFAGGFTSMTTPVGACDQHTFYTTG